MKNIFNLLDDSTIGCAGGVIKNICENEVGEAVSKAMSSSFGVGNATFRLGGKRAFVDTVAFGAYRRQVFEKIGGFDSTLIRNQDDEYNFRVSKAGYKILFDPEIISCYYVRSSYRNLAKQYYQYGYWKVYVNKKHGVVTTMRQLVPAGLVSCLTISLMGGLIHEYSLYFALAVVILYVFAGLFFAARIASSIKETLLVLMVFFTLHFSYGTGYLKGILDFILLRKKPGIRNAVLTR
ncbi:MAG: hypothetical protein IT215_04065 [Chitinophagaceae bacterium]|nr:hypothetical protein [Chitinophagaceae bacterium]